MFRTELHLAPASDPIGIDQSVLSIGSCFSECIGGKLQKHKFDVLANPFGTVFNPLSINVLLRRAIRNDLIRQDELVEYQGIWSHRDFHSSFSGPNKHMVAENLNLRITEAHNFLVKCEVIFVTFGTAYIYRKSSDDTLVSNCHKQPSGWFSRSLLTIDEIVSDFNSLVRELEGKRFILTVSPVRHTRDTLPLNNLSKSILRVACQGIIEKQTEVEYFPSLEIMHDDLRDYRFYDSDLIHPNSMGESYIWEKFITHYFTSGDKKFIHTIAELNKRIDHKPNHPGSENHLKFLTNLLSDLNKLNDKVDFQREIEKVKAELDQEI